jgi:hypothetical protein
MKSTALVVSAACACPCPITDSACCCVCALSYRPHARAAAGCSARAGPAPRRSFGPRAAPAAFCLRSVVPVCAKTRRRWPHIAGGGVCGLRVRVCASAVATGAVSPLQQGRATGPRTIRWRSSGPVAHSCDASSPDASCTERSAASLSIARQLLPRPPPPPCRCPARDQHRPRASPPTPEACVRFPAAAGAMHIRPSRGPARPRRVTSGGCEACLSSVLHGPPETAALLVLEFPELQQPVTADSGATVPASPSPSSHAPRRGGAHARATGVRVRVRRATRAVRTVLTL